MWQIDSKYNVYALVFIYTSNLVSISLYSSENNRKNGKSFQTELFLTIVAIDALKLRKSQKKGAEGREE
jgi:hypothetical protein